MGIVHRSGIALLLVVVAAFVGCGKDSEARVKRPAAHFWLCPSGGTGATAKCRDRFDANQLVGMRFDAASRLANAHGFRLRRYAPLRPDEGLTANELSARIDVECESATPNCVVLRVLRLG